MNTTVGGRSGFATTAALLMMAVVSAALLTLGQLLRADANRTLRESQDAQLRQLLHAGAVEATIKSSSGLEAPKSWDVVLPAGVDGAVHIEIDARRATINASFSDHHMSETIELDSRR